MNLTTRLPVAVFYFRHWHTDDTEVGIVVAKAEFVRRSDGGFRSIPQAPELVMEDVFEGEVGASPLVQEQDIAPGKAGTDVIVKAIARSPEGKPRPEWPVTVSIADRLHYGFQVRGPAEWRRGLTGWKLTQPELVNEVPVSYALAYGGASPTGDDEAPWAWYENNPAGIGLATKARLDEREPFPAPQIGELAEFVAGNPAAEMAVHGFGPVAKAWLPRRGHAGTFDEDWETERHPRMPLDYSLQFWNAAQRQMQLNPPLAGDEVIRLSGVSHDLPVVELSLPRVALMLTATAEDGAEEVQTMVLDTVVADVTAADPAEHKLTQIWRARITNPGSFVDGRVESMKMTPREPAVSGPVEEQGEE